MLTTIAAMLAVLLIIPSISAMESRFLSDISFTGTMISVPGCTLKSRDPLRAMLPFMCTIYTFRLTAFREYPPAFEI